MHEGRPAGEHVRSSQWLVLGLLALGLLAAVGAWLYQRQVQHLPLETWGSEACDLILNAPKVELALYEPRPAGGLSGSQPVAEEIRSIDVSGRNGLLHIRKGLLDSHSYGPMPSFHRTGVDQPPALPTHGLRFTDAGRSVEMLFNFDEAWAETRGSGKMLSIGPIAAGLKQTFDDYVCEADGK